MRYYSTHDCARQDFCFMFLTIVDSTQIPGSDDRPVYKDVLSVTLKKSIYTTTAVLELRSKSPMLAGLRM